MLLFLFNVNIVDLENETKVSLDEACAAKCRSCQKGFSITTSMVFYSSPFVRISFFKKYKVKFFTRF